MAVNAIQVAAAALTLLISTALPAAAEAKADKDLQSIVDGSQRFGAKLYQLLRRGGDNLFFSPASISIAMAMTWGGARGETARQMARAMSFRLPAKRTHASYKNLLAALRSSSNTAGARGGMQLKVANALWGQSGHPFLAPYLKLVRDSYDGGLEQVDFRSPDGADRARDAINAWVRRRTAGKISELVSSGLLKPRTRLVLTNAVYFKGTWKTIFPGRATQKRSFRLVDGGRVKAPLMKVTASFRYRGTRAFQALELPYKGGRTSMVILLPRRVGSLGAVERYLQPRRLRGLLRSMPRRKVVVHLPRFSIDHSLDLTGKLKALGIKAAFSDRADFSAMDGTRLLYLSAALHRAWVEVNEEGTEAAAATAVFSEMLEGESEPAPPEFIADRPFLFLIRDRATGCVLFMGRLMNPGGEIESKKSKRSRPAVPPRILTLD
jgi:serpin B